MKFLKYFLTIMCAVNLSLIASDEEEIKTIEIDGVIYKVNPGSLNITPSEGNVILEETESINTNETVIEVAKDNTSEKKSNITAFFNVGQLFPINNTDNLDSGTSFGFSVDLPKTISLFGKELSPSIEINSATLSGIGLSDDVTLTSVVGQLSTSLSMLDLSLGLGYTNHSTSAVTGSAMLDLGYKLPIKKMDLSLVLRLQKVVDINKDYELTFDTQDSYGVYLKYGKSINF